jgi:type IX secretion system PorP/SprF family membrane protein
LYNEYSVAQFNYRNQWPISNLYTSYGASYFQDSPDLNSNFGAIVKYDNQYNGTFSQSSVGLNYAYKLQIARQTNFLFGLQAFYNYSSANYSNLTFENPTINLPSNESNSFPTINSGIGLLIHKEHFIGISANNLFNFANANSNLIINATYIGKYKGNYYSDISYEPLINISSDLNYLQLKYGGNINFSPIKIGFLLSQNGINFNAFVILLGISFENYDIVYTYDLNLSEAVTINPKMAAHEVTFLYKFEYKGRSKHKGAIKCPDI